MLKNRNSAIIIKPEKTKEFFAELYKNRATKDYWKNCWDGKMSDEDLKRMERLCAEG